jgi:Ca2+-binding EF-hand superfamily protein
MEKALRELRESIRLFLDQLNDDERLLKIMKKFEINGCSEIFSRNIEVIDDTIVEVKRFIQILKKKRRRFEKEIVGLKWK